ncbi:BON domain-containing protein [Vibrio proteolyticus]|nr:BON domain-containing protein [Vibrio proteolyticus]
MKRLKTLLLTAVILSTSGCAGLFVAGAATTANIVTDPRSTQEIWNDNNIEFEVAGIGNKAPYTGNVRIVASSYNGTVVLMGQARNQELLDQFVAQARDVKGVKTIYNQVRIKAPLSVGEISHDSWITTKVKSSLLADSELTTVKIKVITEDKEVFLLGYVKRAHADKAVNIARNISGVKQVIKAFEYAD